MGSHLPMSKTNLNTRVTWRTTSLLSVATLRDRAAQRRVRDEEAHFFIP